MSSASLATGASATFDRLLAEKRFPSPLIIEGSETSPFLIRMARTALCETQNLCETCRSCRQSAKGFHPDWLTSEGSLKIEDLRDLLHGLRQKPFQSRYRVFTLHQTEACSVAVQNALLKTLEEPLAHWILLLGVTSRFRLLETIRSRCLLFKVPPSAAPKNTPELDSLFSAIENRDELNLYTLCEALTKDRAKTRTAFVQLLERAAHHGYPGHWTNLAPSLEAALADLDRNLNPRLVWDTAWARSFEELRGH